MTGMRVPVAQISPPQISGTLLRNSCHAGIRTVYASGPLPTSTAHSDTFACMVPLNRREFLIAPAAAAAFAADTAVPWQRKIRRVGQTNMTEHDPAVLDVEQWADYWASLKVDAVLVSVTGILAFYQTKVPFHRKGKFLGDRDFFGDCCAAAKKRGMHVIARMSPDLNWEDAVAGPSGMVPARRAGQRRPPHRGPAALPHLHVHHLHDRLHAGHHAGGQLAATTSTACSPTPGRRSARCPSAIASSARSCRRPAPSHIGRSSTSAPSICGSSTTPSPRRRSPLISTSRIWAAASAAPPTW